MLKSKTINFKEVDDSISKLGKEIIFIKEGDLVNASRVPLNLAKRVTWYTKDNKGVGCDILSFYPDGGEIYIKVITTKNKAIPKITLSKSEKDFMDKNPDQYHLYLLTNFSRSKQTAELSVYTGKDEIKTFVCERKS